jgi:monoamine oxidase
MNPPSDAVPRAGAGSDESAAGLRGAPPPEKAVSGSNVRGSGPHGLTRRALLVGVGAAGGAGAMYAVMGALGLAPSSQDTAFVPPQPSDFALRGTGSARVAVLGAGVAGLTCAYELGKAGYDCTVLEARDVAGGRNLTLRGGDRLPELDGESQTVRFGEGVYFNTGPGRIAQWMVTLDYCRELGVPIETFVNNNASAYVYNEGMTAPVRARTARADMYGYVAELLAKATDAGALDAELTGEDKERLLEFLTRFGDIGEKLTYEGSPRRGFLRYPTSDPGSPVPPPGTLSEVLASGVGRALTLDFGHDQAMPMFQPVGGMDAIVRALVREIGEDRIRVGARVTKITSTAADVEIVYAGPDGPNAIRADYCIATLPPHLLAAIPHNLGAQVTSALRTPTPVSAGKLGLEYRRRWWETDDRIYGGITETDLDISHIWYPSHGYHGERGLLVGYYNIGDHADAYGRMTHADRVRRAIEQGVRIHGAKYRDELLSGVSIAWHRQPHIQSGWAAWPSYGGPYELLQRPAGRVYFAGDWLTRLVAWQAGAMESARKVVTLLHQRALQAG